MGTKPFLEKQDVIKCCLFKKIIDVKVSRPVFFSLFCAMPQLRFSKILMLWGGPHSIYIIFNIKKLKCLLKKLK